MNGATLAACQERASAPIRASIAVQIVCEVARALHAAHARHDPATGRLFVHGNVSPENILVRYDGGVELVAPTDAARAQALRAKPAYLAPEQITASDVDRRADVFALGVVLWELLTSARLFERADASTTRIAIIDDPIPDARDLNPLVPEMLAQILGAALERKREGRFDNVDAFGKALAGVRASSGIEEASKADVARWVAERVPPADARASAASAPAAAPVAAPSLPSAPRLPSAIPDLDLPGASRAHRSRPSMQAVKAPSAAAIPTFDTTAMAAEALAPSTRPPAMSAPPVSGRTSSPSSAGVAGGGREIAFDAGDDDDFDMQIERNIASTSIPAATSSRMSGAPGRTSGAPRAAGTGLELAQPSRMKREEAQRSARAGGEPGVAAKLGGALLTLAIAGGTAFALLHQVHRAGGYDATRALPHAFDGTSATESGAVALVALVASVTLGFVGLKLRPYAWTIVASGGALLLVALAMVTVTLASTGENPTPPDGVLLVPYLLPAALVLLALGVQLRSARLFARAQGARRAGAIPVAAIAGALAFVAFEISRFAR